jgi:ABC-type uncharacterized transport system involved in gliding motility auxiliary subunit
MRKQKQLQWISNFTVLFIIVIFTLCAWLSTRFYFEFDLTRSGKHTISQASIQTLNQAAKELKISAYAREDSELRLLISRFVGRFQKVKPDISLRFINPDAAPDEVRSLGINVNGELVLRYDGRIEHVKSDNEQEFINALQRLLRGAERWLAFLDGHGERNPQGKANHDLGEWVDQLSYRGFKFRPINLVETNVIPDNTSVLIIASPLVALLPGELQLIEKFLEKGGNLLWLVDPGEQSNMSSVAALLGVKIEPGTIIDTAGSIVGNDPTITLTTARLYPEHPLTKDFALTVFYPKATAISSLPRPGWLARPVLNSGNHTWLELGELNDKIDFNPETERQGPLSLAIGLERELSTTVGTGVSHKQQRVLVVGDGDFLSNTYVGNSGNLELGMRMINWLASDDSLITIPPRTLDDAQLNMSQLALGIIGIVLLLVLPICFLVAGLLIWSRRKKL